MDSKEKKAGKGHLRPKKLIIDDSIMGVSDNTFYLFFPHQLTPS